MAFAYIASASDPADNAAQNSTATVTPPSMNTGDLVIVVAEGGFNPSLPTMAWSEQGGQDWTQVGVGEINGNTVGTQIWFCRFNGTWSANPAFSISSSRTITLVMKVYRPTGSTYTFAVDAGPNTASYSTPGLGVATTITGITTTADSTVTLACWYAADNPTWGSMSGTGWVETGGPQYRNADASGNLCASFAHYIQTSAGATGNVSKTQGAGNKAAGITVIFAIKEIAPTGRIVIGSGGHVKRDRIVIAG